MSCGEAHLARQNIAKIAEIRRQSGLLRQALSIYYGRPAGARGVRLEQTALNIHLLFLGLFRRKLLSVKCY